VVRENPVVALLRLTDAPGTRAPFWSVIAPRRELVADWPKAITHVDRRAKATDKTNRRDEEDIGDSFQTEGLNCKLSPKRSNRVRP
jgi:hypothetical protein